MAMVLEPDKDQGSEAGRAVTITAWWILPGGHPSWGRDPSWTPLTGAGCSGLSLNSRSTRGGCAALTPTRRIVVRAGFGHAFDLLGRADPAPEPRVTGRHSATAREERVAKYN